MYYPVRFEVKTVTGKKEIKVTKDMVSQRKIIKLGEFKLKLVGDSDSLINMELKVDPELIKDTKINNVVTKLRAIFPGVAKSEMKKWLKKGDTYLNNKMKIAYEDKEGLVYNKGDFVLGKIIELADKSKGEIIANEYKNILVVNRENRHGTSERVVVMQRGNHRIVTPLKNDYVDIS